MPIDRYRQSRDRDRVYGPGRVRDMPKDWRGGVLRTFIVRHAENKLICGTCGRMPKQGDVMATYVDDKAQKSYHHYEPEQCGIPEDVRTLTQRRRERNRERVAARHPELDDE